MRKQRKLETKLGKEKILKICFSVNKIMFLNNMFLGKILGLSGCELFFLPLTP